MLTEFWSSGSICEVGNPSLRWKIFRGVRILGTRLRQHYNDKDLRDTWCLFRVCYKSAKVNFSKDGTGAALRSRFQLAQRVRLGNRRNYHNLLLYFPNMQYNLGRFLPGSKAIGGFYGVHTWSAFQSLNPSMKRYILALDFNSSEIIPRSLQPHCARQIPGVTRCASAQILS